MIDNEHDADPVMVGHSVAGAWPVGDDAVATVAAWAATYADGDGTRTIPVVRLAIAPDALDDDGALTVSADDAASLAATLDHAAEHARRAVIV